VSVANNEDNSMIGFVYVYDNVYVSGNYNLQFVPVSASTDNVHSSGSFGWYDYGLDKEVCFVGANSDVEKDAICDFLETKYSMTFDRTGRVGIVSWFGDTNCNPNCNFKFGFSWGHAAVATLHGIYPIYDSVEPEPTPTTIPDLTPTSTPEPCPFIDTGQSAEVSPAENYLAMGMGDTELQVTFTGGDVSINFDGDEYFVECEDGVPCDLEATSRVPSQSFWCYSEAGICETGLFESRAFYCPGSYELPEFEATGVEGTGITFTSRGSVCWDLELDAFDLSDYPLLTVIADVFGLTVPAWGWSFSEIEICLDKYEIENVEIGNFDFTPFVVLALSALVLIVVAWVIRR
jgi:hypothetical protein